MSRLKNIINDKERKTQCVMTENSIMYKIPIGAEERSIGHFIQWEVVDNNLVFSFATKKVSAPTLRIEKFKEPFVLSFD
jgi:hypothetical protein